MRRLNTRQRFGFILGFYFFFWLIIFYIIFLVIFNLVVSYQFNKELLAESSDIIQNHLVVEQKSLVFVKDQGGASLKEYLITHNTPAVFLTSDGKILRTYGLFAISAGVSQSEYFGKMINSYSQKEKYIEKTIPWNGQTIKSFIVPLKAKGKVVGFIVIGKSLDEVNNIFNIMTILFISLGVFNFAGSFVVGFLLARLAFMPLRKMIGVMEKIDYDNLNTLLPIDEYSKDEVSALSARFNDMLVRLGDMAGRQKAFITNVSHELKTPLARAISSLDLLSQDSQGVKQEINLIREDLFGINSLIERLLLLARIRKDKQIDKPRIIFLKDFFERIKKIFEIQLINKQITLNIVGEEKAEFFIPKEYLNIIFSNLLLNSIKYSHPRTSIDISSLKQDGKTVISVADSGIGMDNEEAKRMFERFFRGKGTREEGHGIGLSLVKQICSLYNIGIKVVSKKDKGTTIFLHFP
jgi:signal transduction histidine kinase